MMMGNNSSKRGLTFFEVVVTLALISFIMTMAMPSFDLYFRRMELRNTLRTITGVLNTARFKAVMLNNPVKFCIEEKNKYNEEKELCIRLKEKRYNQWEKLMEFSLENKVTVSINSSPVFYPNGNVSPLCSIVVENELCYYKVTISIAGRVKITEVKL
jgi:Tfp pilus assembly protein FimT